MSPETPPPFTPQTPPPWEALARFFAGESPAGEATAIAAWIAANPEDAAVAAAVNDAAGQWGDDVRQPIDTEAALASVLARRDTTPALPQDIRSLDAARAARASGKGVSKPSGEVNAGVGRGVASTSRWGRRWGAWAAAAVVTVSVGSVLFSGLRGSDRVAGAASLSVATAIGAIDSLTLDDGTRVVLGPGSSLVHEAGYGVTSREVFLTGDGFFDVAPNDAQPFTVLAGKARIVDLGTAFTVRSDAERGVAVTVTSGRVQLAAYNAPDLGVELAAGESARLPDTSRQPVRDTVALADATEWTRGTLLLRDASLADVAVALRRWFGITLVAHEALAEQRVTGTFRSEGRETVLEVIALSLGARVEMRGDTARLTVAGSGPQ